MKKIFLMLALISAVVSANAQIATENSNALDNIGVGITAGVSTPLDFNSVFPLNTNVGVKVTKDITPVVGLQLEGLVFLNDNHFSDLKTVVKATNVGLNGAINMSNLFCGYNGTPRNFEVSAVAGLGWLHNWDTPFNSLTAKTGLDFAFNLGSNKAHSIVLTPAVYWDLHKFDAIHFDKRGAQLALNASYIYHFRTSNGTHHFKTYDVGAMNDEINRLRGSLEECEKREPQVIEKVIEKVVIKEVPVEVGTKTALVAEDGTWTVTFANNSFALSNEAKFILNQIGNDAIVNVTATASPTGTAEYNQILSERRAKAVADYLQKRGVKVNSWEGKGVNLETGRSAIVKTLQ